jgi:hypothetical protein
MSWDIYAMRLPPGTNMMDLPDDHRPQPFGARQTVIDAVLAAAPYADVRDPAWLDVSGPDLVVEVNVGAEDVVDSVMFHVRGGEQAVPFILAVCERLGIEPWDIGEGRPLRADSGRDSQSKWEAYRDMVIAPPQVVPGSRDRWWMRRRK